MGTSRTLCVLLLAGATLAFPQYGQSNQGNAPENLPANPEADPLAALEQLSQSQLPLDPEATVDALEQFWWQNQGVFNPENSEGVDITGINAGTLPQLDTFIPSPSKECGEFHGCVPWSNCKDGIFTNTGEGILGLRTYSQVPEDFGQPKCGQTGNVCCRIPDDILAAQTQGGSGGVIISGDSTNNAGPDGVIIEAVVGDGADPYQADGEVVVLIDDGNAPTGVGATDTVAVVKEEDITQIVGTGCSPLTHDCVVAYQCINGEINTSGTGLLDLRVGPNKECINPNFPDVKAVCCRIPYLTCSGSKTCVPQSQCSSDGTVNIDGTEISDTSNFEICHIDNINYEEGVCCDAPEDIKLPPCPSHQACETACAASGTGSSDDANTGTECYLEDSSIGQCCDTKPELDSCPVTEECVESHLCKADGFINTDGSALIDLRTYKKKCYIDPTTFTEGVCCKPPLPPTPAPLKTCPGHQVCSNQGICESSVIDLAVSTYDQCYLEDSSIGQCCDNKPELDPCPVTEECVDSHLCDVDGFINTDGSDLIDIRHYRTKCYTDPTTFTEGVCCKPPLPPTPAPLATCPGSQVCSVESLCSSATGTAETTNYVSCYVAASDNLVGVCCDPPTVVTPVTPVPLTTCPGTQTCSHQDTCATQAAATGSDLTTYDICYVDGANDKTGICCDSPTRVEDVCPGDSVCNLAILCQGDTLDQAGNWGPYDGSSPVTQCALSGITDTTGVCCRNKVTPTPTPSTPTQSTYKAADKCGVRNHGLDLRFGGPKLEKNEAQFGEFSWQAIIFFTNYTYKCGASIIGDRWLLTAAHCVHGFKHNDFKVRLGEWQVDKYDEALPYVDVDIAKISVHQDFKPGPVHNDIALIELTEPIKFQYHINSVCVPKENQIPPGGTRCFASGWGKDAFDGSFQPILKKIELPVIEHGECQSLLRKTRLGRFFILDKSFMCAGGEVNKDACEGDGGGPLVCEDPATHTYYIAGITAWGIDCGQENVPGVYVNVQKFQPWIENLIRGDEQIAEQQQQQGSSSPYGR